VDQLERTVDEYEDKLDSYLVKLSGRTYSRKDSHMLSTLLHCISDFERITDHALNVMQIAGEMNGKEQNFSAKAQEELRVFSDAVTDIIDRAVEAFKNYDLKMAKTIEPLEEVIDGINMEIKRRHVRRLRKGKCTIELGFSLTDITTNYERIADHCSNIAVCLLQVNEDGFDTHEYLERVWNKDDEEFRKMAEDYEAQYTLPGSKTDDLPVILEGKELAEAMVRTPEETAAVQAALEEVTEETSPKKKKKDKEKDKEKEKAEKAAKKAEKKAKKEKKMLEESLTEEGPA
jgi:phosphate:Na+ symporter